MCLRSTCVLTFVAVVSILGNHSATADESAAPIIVGVVHSSAHPSAESMKRSFEMAVEKTNKDGGAKGRPLKLVYADDGVKTSGSIGYQRANEERAIESLLSSGAVMLIGGYSSANTIHTAYHAEKSNIPFLVTTAADNQITRRKFRNVYRLNPPATEYGGAVEELLSA